MMKPGQKQSPRVQALLALKRKLHSHIAGQHGAEPPMGQQPPHPGAGHPPMDEEDLADGGADEAAEGEPPTGGLGPMDGKGGGNPLHEQFAAYLNPKPKPRRPGTGVMIGITAGKAPEPPRRPKGKGMA